MTSLTKAAKSLFHTTRRGPCKVLAVTTASQGAFDRTQEYDSGMHVRVYGPCSSRPCGSSQAIPGPCSYADRFGPYGFAPMRSRRVLLAMAVLISVVPTPYARSIRGRREERHEGERSSSGGCWRHARGAPSYLPGLRWTFTVAEAATLVSRLLTLPAGDRSRHSGGRPAGASCSATSGPRMPAELLQQTRQYER